MKYDHKYNEIWEIATKYDPLIMMKYDHKYDEIWEMATKYDPLIIMKYDHKYDEIYDNSSQINHISSYFIIFLMINFTSFPSAGLKT